MKMVLHVGPPKTGTSYIQTLLNHNWAELMEHDWEYPPAGQTPKNWGHHLLAYRHPEYLTPGTDGYAALSALATTGNNIVMSAEGFVGWQTEQFEALAKVTGATDIEIVFLLRNPFQVFYSTWKEMVKQGKLDNLPEFFMQHFADPSHSALINPTMLLRKMSLLPSPYRLTILSYDQLRASKTPIFDPIWYKVLGIASPYHEHRKSVNQSFTIEISEFLRMLLADYKEQHPETEMIKARLAFERLIDPLDRVKKRGEARRLRDLALAARIDDAFETIRDRKRTFSVPTHTGVHTYLRAQIWEEFGKHFMPGTQPEGLISTDPVALEYYRAEDLRGCGALMDLMAEIMTMIPSQIAAHDARIAGR